MYEFEASTKRFKSIVTEVKEANMCIIYYTLSIAQQIESLKNQLKLIHTLRVHYAHAAANLNSGYSKYAKVARVHYFCTIALRTCRAVLTRA